MGSTGTALSRWCAYRSRASPFRRAWAPADRIVSAHDRSPPYVRHIRCRVADRTRGPATHGAAGQQLNYCNETRPAITATPWLHHFVFVRDRRDSRVCRDGRRGATFAGDRASHEYCTRRPVGAHFCDGRSWHRANIRWVCRSRQRCVCGGPALFWRLFRARRQSLADHRLIGGAAPLSKTPRHWYFVLRPGACRRCAPATGHLGRGLPRSRRPGRRFDR